MTISHSKYNVLDLFSGIGGFSLGLERTGGFETTAFCEICPKARKVLNKHWANVKQYTDIRELTNEQLKADGIGVDVITGGFPCQDISCAGKGKGIKAERSGLWSEMFRLIGDVRPAWTIIENVSALRSKGLTLVLQNLCEIGYMCEWHCIPASAVGAPHQRDRIWIVAHPSGECDKPRIRETLSRWKDSEASDTEPSSRDTGRDTVLGEVSDEERPNDTVAHTICQFFRGSMQGQKSSKESSSKKGWREVWSESIADCASQSQVSNTVREGLERQWLLASGIKKKLENPSDPCRWAIEPTVGRVAHGVPNRVDRLKQLGNSVVPQIPELIGNAILEVGA